MASVTIKISGLAGLERLANFDMKGALAESVETALEAGEQAMKEAISTRGTGKTWSHPWYGRTGSMPGRVDQGDMLDDVRGILTKKTKREAAGNLGWDEGSPDYYRYQEEGFDHILTNETVEGMFALRDARDITENVLRSELEDIAGRF